MTDSIRVVQYGVGAMGSNMVRLLQDKPQARLVAAIDHDPKKIGRDVGDVAGLARSLGIVVRHPQDEALERVEADVVLLAITAFAKEAFPLILGFVTRACNVVTIAQEFFFPVGDENRRMAREIDAAATGAGVTVVSVGINPGFAMDVVPIVCSLPCWSIDDVFVRRVVDFSPYGPDEMRHIGVGLAPEEFDRGVRDGTVGHIGLLETAAMVAHCLGLPVDHLQQTKRPLVTDHARQTEFASIAPDRVYGFKQQVVGLDGTRQLLDFEMTAFVAPDAGEREQLGDYTRINGTPSVDVRIKEEIAQRGGLGTAGAAVNAIAKVLEAAPGFRTLNELTMPHIWTGSPAPGAVGHISST
jgi:hypothetical protein